VSSFVGDSIDNPSVKPWPTGDTNEASLPAEKYAAEGEADASGYRGAGRTRSGHDQRRRREPSQGAETLKIANDAKSGDVLEVAGEVLHAPPPCRRLEETL
jgi:hypothetical protein